MLDNTTILLNSAGHKSRNINESYKRNLECVTETNESSSFHRGVNVKASSKYLRLIADDSNNLSFDFCESDDNVFGVVGHDLEEFVSVSDVLDDL